MAEQELTYSLKILGEFDSLEAALQKAANYWDSPLTYQELEPGTHTLKEQGSDVIVGYITLQIYSSIKRTTKKKKQTYLLKVRPKDFVFDLIEHGDKVTILSPHNQRLTGVARIRNAKAEVWVCAKGDTPLIASQDNVVQVTRKGKVIYA